jgi:hypothetical protein
MLGATLNVSTISMAPATPAPAAAPPVENKAEKKVSTWMG